MKCNTLSNAFVEMNSLKKLSLYSNDKLHGDCLQYLPLELEAITLSFCDAIDSMSLINFFQSHANLKCLEISHCNGVNEAVLLVLAESQPGLQSLLVSQYYKREMLSYYYDNLVHPYDIEIGLLKLRLLKSLEQLDLSQNEYVTDVTVMEIAYNCKELREISLAQLPHLTSVGFLCLRNCSKLQKLDVSNSDEIDMDTLIAIAHLTHLDFVTARRCPKIKEKDLKQLGDRWPTERKTIFQF